MEEFKDRMRPTKTASMVNIPITFSRKGEGAVNGKTLFLVISISTLVFIIMLVGLWGGPKGWYIKLPVTVILVYMYTFILRFFVFREGRLSDAYETMVESDYKLSTNVFWNIYDVDTVQPYVVHYVNGLKGVFVRFNKGVIVGKEDYMQYKHFEAIGDMYNLAHILKMDIVNLDYMDSVGNDPRMSKLYSSASNTQNPELKSILVTMYSHLEREMSLDYSSYDVYLFTTKGREEDLWYNVRRVIEVGLKANYSSYSLIDAEELRKMAKAFMNLDSFSLIEAEKEVINNSLTKRIRPINLYKGDGTVEKINLTLEELKKQREAQLEKRKNTKQVKPKKEVTKNDELVDLFDGTTALDEQWEFDTKDDDKKKVKESKDTFDDNIF